MPHVKFQFPVAVNCWKSFFLKRCRVRLTIFWLFLRDVKFVAMAFLCAGRDLKKEIKTFKPVLKAKNQLWLYN